MFYQLLTNMHRISKFIKPLKSLTKELIINLHVIRQPNHIITKPYAKLLFFNLFIEHLVCVRLNTAAM